jgi:hypothetical protein
MVREKCKPENSEKTALGGREEPDRAAERVRFSDPADRRLTHC